MTVNEAKLGPMGLSWSLLLIGLVILVSLWLKLRLEWKILIAALRATIQLFVLGYCLLVPIFSTTHWWVVTIYLVFMAVVASRESSSRPSLTYSMLWRDALLSIILCPGSVLVFAVTCVVSPVPWWSPRFVIPVFGMIVGNSLSAFSLAMDRYLSMLKQSHDQVSLRLSLGASRWEATLPFIRQAFNAGLTPNLNQMSVVGLVSIPGMMTGQLLGGQSPDQAANYQLMILFCIIASGTLTISVCLLLVTSHVIDGSNRLHAWRINRRNEETTLITTDPFCHSIESLKSTQPMPHLRISHFDVFTIGLNPCCVASDMSFTVGFGEVVAVCGPSGIGKSMLLRSLSSLHPSNGSMEIISPSTTHDTTALLLDGSVSMNLRNTSNASWRSHVAFVPQDVPSMLGTPLDLFSEGAQYRSRRGKPLAKESELIRRFERVQLSGDLIHREWSELSGGQRQRCLLCIFLSLEPSILLLDEPTAACDEKTAQSVESLIHEEGKATLWVTHSIDQAKRVSTSKVIHLSHSFNHLEDGKASVIS